MVRLSGEEMMPLRLNEIKQEIDALEKDIDLFVRENLRNKDSEGYAFLSNIHRGEPINFQMALRFGFKHPIYKIAKMVKMQKQSEEEYLILSGNMESVWVKEGLK
jgi:hypothetical protein